MIKSIRKLLLVGGAALFVAFIINLSSPFCDKSAEGVDRQESDGHSLKMKGLAPFLNKLEKRDNLRLEYDEETGEPMCPNCHFGDKKPVIDYTSESECLQCHNADYSERFLEIDERYKVSLIEATESYRRHRNNKIVTPSAKGQKKVKTPKGMVLIPGGEFIMGTDEWWPKSGPQHKRNLPGYFIGKYEVTNREYLEFVKATVYKKPDHWLAEGGNIPKGEEDHPITYVNWFDADAYCKWADKRLPTEPEWEKAARGTDGRVFPWGNEFDKNKANTPQFGHEGTMKIGSFEDGKSPYGIYDMAGNAFEWTSDWYKAYPGNKHPDPNEGERYRVVRGGSWYDCTYYKCGISAPTFNRIFFNPYTRNNNFGFRCVQDAK